MLLLLKNILFYPYNICCGDCKENGIWLLLRNRCVDEWLDIGDINLDNDGDTILFCLGDNCIL